MADVGQDGTIAAMRRSCGMGPREEDNGVVLLSAVALICGAIAFVPWLFEASPAEASKAPAAMVRQAATAEPVRVIVPFTPNTIPSQR